MVARPKPPPPPPPAGAHLPPAAPAAATEPALSVPASDQAGAMRASSLFELDAPMRASSMDFDLEAPAAAPPAAAIPAGDPGQIAGLQAELHRVAMPTPERPDTPEGKLQQRTDRIALRIVTCRDAMRILTTLELNDQDRKPVARQLLELGNAVLGPGLGVQLLKDPDAALASAAAPQIEALERLVGPLEDKLLGLDELVAAGAFRECIESGKHAKKALARYGRLLAGRRMQNPDRRNRFEWIADRLLSLTDSAGVRTVLPPARARQVLDYLIGGLPHRTNAQELADAVESIREALRRLQRFTTHGEFIEGDFYFDAHGHKVTMRELILEPEFLYLSVVLNAHVHNRIEAWTSGDGSLRTQLATRMREQEEAVEDALGFRRKPQPPPTARAEAPRPVEKLEPKKRAWWSFGRG